MEKKYSLTLDKEFVEFCRVNDITDVEKFAQSLFQRTFNQLKYGDEPKGFLKSREKVREETENKWVEKGLIPEDKIIPNNMEKVEIKIKKENSLYDE